MHRFTLRVALIAVVATAALAAAAPTQAVPPDDRYQVTPLVSDMPGVAPVTDPNLVNAWGLARSATSPWWVADNGTQKTTVYNASGVLQMVGGLPAQGVPGNPTGAVFSGIAGQFQVGTTATPTTLGTSNFIFDGEDGTIEAWRGGSTAALVTVDRSSFGAEYKGLAIAGTGDAARIYATDFHNGRVDVFDGSWTLATPPGAFVDPKLPKGFAPFGIQTIGSRIFVTYGQQGDEGDEVDAPGAGVVDVYDTSGVFLHRVASRGVMNAPWGLAMAPASFGPFGGDLLIGNFGDGVIQVFRELGDGSWDHQGILRDKNRLKFAIDGLWALEFGNAGSNGTPGTLFFTAGPGGEDHGLFGSIVPFTPPAPPAE
jgi:uncharacterized protein (TIGR03118 family)